MTRDEILNLSIYETEQLVIDKILGWELSDRGFYADKDGQSPESYYTPANFKPGRDIAAAWMVLEKFTDVDIEKAGENYRVTINAFAQADAHTLPLAVCRAALLAVLVPA